MKPLDCNKLEINRNALNLYGSNEMMIRKLRLCRPMDLSAMNAKKSNSLTYGEWQAKAKSHLLDHLHCPPINTELNSKVIAKEEREGYIQETVLFNSAPWSRLEGYFLYPSKIENPVPALVVFHAWGGPILFGKERIVNTGRDHQVLKEYRDEIYSGNYLAEEFVKKGYAVIVIDNFHFGKRSVRDVNGIPSDFDPYELNEKEFVEITDKSIAMGYQGLKQLMWAGTTWSAINYIDDKACVDFLISRSEVDSGNIGCTGLSGGGWRTNMLAALDDRIKASVSVGWMTTCDYQQIYNVGGAVGLFNLLPGVWDRMDIPDLAAMTAPNACMIVSGQDDPLFPVEAQIEAEKQIKEAFKWANKAENFYSFRPSKKHCYDSDIQEEAIGWFDSNLK